MYNNEHNHQLELLWIDYSLRNIRLKNALNILLVFFDYLKSIFACLASNLKYSIYILNITNIDPMKKKIPQANPINRLSPRIPNIVDIEDNGKTQTFLCLSKVRIV
jgi:hypothetical protein